MNENEVFVDINIEDKDIGSCCELLDDRSLENATGGGYFQEHVWNTPDEVRFIFYPGDIVNVRVGLVFWTARARVVRCEAGPDTNNQSGAIMGYKDKYIVEAIDAEPGDFMYFYKRVAREDIWMD